MRNIRRLDSYRASPLGLKSVHFRSEGEADAYNFPLGRESNLPSDLSESEYGEESFISRESTPSPISVSECEDTNIHTAVQKDDSKTEDDEAVHGKSQQRTEYSQSEDVEVCTYPQQSASDVDDEAFSPEYESLHHL